MNERTKYIYWAYFRVIGGNVVKWAEKFKLWNGPDRDFVAEFITKYTNK